MLIFVRKIYYHVLPKRADRTTSPRLENFCFSRWRTFEQLLAITEAHNFFLAAPKMFPQSTYYSFERQPSAATHHRGRDFHCVYLGTLKTI